MSYISGIHTHLDTWILVKTSRYDPRLDCPSLGMSNVDEVSADKWLSPSVFLMINNLIGEIPEWESQIFNK